MKWFHEAPRGVRVLSSAEVSAFEPHLWVGPFETLRDARAAAIVVFQWQKKDVEDKIKALRAIDLRCQPRGK